MIEICKNLYIGNQRDYEVNINNNLDWCVIHACKEPYHRDLLGYTSRGAPKDHPEYLVAKRNNRMFLNIVDANSSDYIPKEIIDAALLFIDESISSEKACLVHCNLGESRSPSIGLLYMVSKGQLPTDNLESAEEKFRKIYPLYYPKPGIRDFIIKHWNIYVK